MHDEQEQYSLYFGDAFDLLHGLENESIDLLFTDIPYNEVGEGKDCGFGGHYRLTKESNGASANELTLDLEELAREFVRVTKGSIFCFCGTKQLSTLISVFEKGGMTTRVYVLEKTNPALLNGTRMPLSAVELAAFARKPNAVWNGNCVPNVLRYPASQCRLHPTEKRVDMCREVVSLASAPGQVVCDPFVGSGSIGVAAVSLSRYFIGSEINREWHNVAECRIREASSEIRQDNANENGNVKRRGSKDLETSIKQENFRKVHLLFGQGYSKSQIAKTLKIDWKTVQRYLAMSEQEFLQSSSYRRAYDRVLDDYENVLRDKLTREPKLSSAQIFRWFHEQYPEVKVSQKTVYNYVSAIKWKG